VHVAAGTYAGNVHVSKAVTVVGDPGDATAGPGASAPVIDGGSLPGSGFFIDNGVANVTIQGFEIANFTSNATGIAMASQPGGQHLLYHHPGQLLS